MISLRSDEALGSVKEQHKLMINPQSNKLLLLLKYPTRQPEELYCDAFGNKPLELRIKPKCGLVEVDVPIDIHHHYDREKGLEFGAALRKKPFAGDSNSFYGISSGLNPGIARNDEDDSSILESASLEKMLKAFDHANKDGYVMNRITLGGRIEPFKDGDPIYMLATFEEGIATWTPLNGMVMLRPQFEHLDALRLQQSPGVRSSRHDAEDKRESKAEDVNMTVKDTEDDEPQDDLYGGMAETLKILRTMADEPWQRLQWVDSGDDRAYGMWEQTMIYQNPDTAPQLVSHMTQEQYLNAISCPRIDPIHKGRNIMRPLDADPDDFGLTTDEEKPPPIGKPQDAKTKYLIEGVCREICRRSEDESKKFIKFVKNNLKHNADYGFLKRSHRFHRFFLWRLKNNRAKRGWSLEKLYRRQEAEREDRKRLGRDVPDGVSIQATDRGMGNEEVALFEGNVPGLSTATPAKKRTSNHGSQKTREELGNVESVELDQRDSDLVQDHNQGQDGVLLKATPGDLGSEAGARKGRSRTRGKKKGQKSVA